MGNLYKVLVAGQSCHKGTLSWSLPQGGQPGEWHEVQGELALCYRGLHITDDAARWWRPGCTIYVVEAEGVLGACADTEDRKVVARRVRLLREATEAELAGMGVYLGGSHVSDRAVIVATGSSSVVARGSSSVVAWDSSSVEAWDSSSVVARGSSRVVAWDSSSVEAWDSSSVEAWDSSSVVASDQVTVISWNGCEAVKVMERAVWIHREREKAPTVRRAAKRAKP